MKEEQLLIDIYPLRINKEGLSFIKGQIKISKEKLSNEKGQMRIDN